MELINELFSVDTQKNWLKFGVFALAFSLLNELTGKQMNTASNLISIAFVLVPLLVISAKLAHTIWKLKQK